MEADAGIKLHELRVDGGATRNRLLMQFQADLLRVPVVRPQIMETTALGAAALAGLAVGLWQDRDELAALWQAEETFTPTLLPHQQILRLQERWQRALERAKNWELPE
jgi:glycerol kinase